MAARLQSNNRKAQAKTGEKEAMNTRRRLLLGIAAIPFLPAMARAALTATPDTPDVGGPWTWAIYRAGRKVGSGRMLGTLVGPNGGSLSFQPGDKEFDRADIFTGGGDLFGSMDRPCPVQAGDTVSFNYSISL